MVTHATGMVLLLIGVAVACICLRDLCIKPHRWTSRGLMALALAAMIAGQAVAGRFGWLDRYEDYILVGTAIVLIYLAQSAIREALSPSRADRFILVGGLAAGLLVFGSRYWLMTANVPLTSNNIYEQQLQMHFFIDRFYKGPVAINDLGLSSYHNPYPVLDLGGLGSEAARKLLASHADTAAYETFVAANGVHLIMVYQEWFPYNIPATWQHVGTLSLSRRALSAAQPDVQFYVTDDATAAKVRQELTAFQKTLPPRVELDID